MNFYRCIWKLRKSATQMSITNYETTTEFKQTSTTLATFNQEIIEEEKSATQMSTITNYETTTLATFKQEIIEEEKTNKELNVVEQENYLLVLIPTILVISAIFVFLVIYLFITKKRKIEDEHEMDQI